MTREIKAFTVSIQYFKETGKLYTGETVQLVTEVLEDGSPYMETIFDAVREMKRTGKLPGLQSGTWTGPILVDCEEGHPRIIQPGE